MISQSSSASQPQGIDTRPASAAFYFNSSAHLLRIGREQASNLGELLQALRTCPEESIFQHTFRTLQEHHFIREGFSNDFAHWAYSQCNEPGLAERLASLDVRRFTSLSSLRDRIVEIVEDYLKDNQGARDRKALEPFYFCASEAVVIPTPFVAHNLSEFIDAMRQISIHAIYHHFIEARLRLKLISNDFSLWLDRELGLKNTAIRLNGIDIYTSTLDGVRNHMIRILQSANN
jgi:hypothetical protein